MKATRSSALAFQVAVAQPAQAKPPLVQQLAHAFPAVLDAKARIDPVLDQLGGPQIHLIARFPGTAAHCLFDLRVLVGGQSREAPWT
jgi:hypothetical protein